MAKDPFNLFRFRSKKQQEKDLQAYTAWAFPYGAAQREKVAALLAQLFPREDAAIALVIFLTGKEAFCDKDGEREDEGEEGRHDEDANDVEEGVGEGGATSVGGGLEGGEPGGDGGADVHAQDQAGGGVEVDGAIGHEDDGDTGGGGGTLDDGRGDGTDEDALEHADDGEGAVSAGGGEEGHGVAHALGFGDGREGAAHELKAKEDEAQTQEDEADELPAFAGGEEVEDGGNADDGHDGGDTDLREDGHQPRGDSGTDVGTDDHVDGLQERHDAAGHHAHHHDRGDGGALNNGGDDGARGDTGEAVGGGGGHDLAHTGPGHTLETLGNLLHAQQKDAQAADEAGHNGGGTCALNDGELFDGGQKGFHANLLLTKS